MSLFLGGASGSLPEGEVFPCVSTAPTGLGAGILPANGSIVSLATYPALTYLNNAPFIAGSAYGARLDTLPANFAASSPSGSNPKEFDSNVIGANHFLCGYNTSNNHPAIAYSSDLVNWAVQDINTDTSGQWCFGIVKSGSTYFVAIAGTSGSNFIYSSTNLTSWILAYTAATGGTVYGSSVMAVNGVSVVVLQGGVQNAVIFNGTGWSTDTNTINPNSESANLSLLSTGELASVSIPSTASPWTINAFKIPASSGASTSSVVTTGLTGSILAPALTHDTAATTGSRNGMNLKISYVGSNYVVMAFGVVYTSSNFTSWANQGDKQFIAMENIGGTLYAIAYIGGVQKYYSSTDGITWTLYYTASADQGLNALNFGARIIQISASCWAICSCATFNGSGGPTTYVSFIWNPTTVPIVMQSNSVLTNISIDPWSFNVDVAGSGLLVGPYHLSPAFNPNNSAQLPNLTSTAGAGTAMFMKI